MESLGQDKVLQTEQVKEAKQQIKTQKEDEKEVKKEQRESRTPLQKLISYVELGGIVLFLSAFRKPLEKIGDKILKDIDNEAIKVTGAVVAKLKGVEAKLRADIIQSHFLDPIQCYRIGGEVYEQLVINGAWSNTIYTHLDPVPSTVDTEFVVGTGFGAVTARSNLVRALSVQMLGISEYLIVNGQDLSQ